LAEAEERVYTEEKGLNSPNAEAQELPARSRSKPDRADETPDDLWANAVGPAGELDGPETAGEEQGGFEDERLARRGRMISRASIILARAVLKEAAKRATASEVHAIASSIDRLYSSSDREGSGVRPFAFASSTASS
jgi:hypothetical protein